MNTLTPTGLAREVIRRSIGAEFGVTTSVGVVDVAPETGMTQLQKGPTYHP